MRNATPLLAPEVASTAAGTVRSWVLTDRNQIIINGRTKLTATMSRAALMGIGGAVLLVLGVSVRYKWMHAYVDDRGRGLNGMC